MARFGIVVSMLAGATSSATAAGPFAYVPSSDTGDLVVVDTATDLIVDTVALGQFVQGAVVNPGGTRVYVTSVAHSHVFVVDATKNQALPNIPTSSFVGHSAPALSPDGTRLYTTSGGVVVIDTTTNTEVTTITHAFIDNPTNVAVTPDGSKLYVGNAFGGKIVVIDTASNTVIGSVAAAGSTRGVDVLPDGSKVYVTDEFVVRVISTATDTELTSIPMSSQATGIAVHPDGTRVYVSTIAGLTVVDSATDSVVTSVPLGLIHFGLAVTPDGTKVYVSSYGTDEVFIVDAATNTSLGSIPVSDPFARGRFIGPELVCGNGVVQPGEKCDDGGLVTGDGCDELCQLEPCFAFQPCAGALTTSFVLKDSTADSKDQVGWKWKKGSIESADLGNPVSSTDYELCVIDDGVPVMVFTIPAGLICDGGKDCWRMLGSFPAPKGFKYTNKSTSSQGVSGLAVKAGVGKASIGFKAKNVQLTLPGPIMPGQYFSQTNDVTVRLRRLDDTQCWESEYSTSSKNDDSQFAAKTP
jgi:cysteine-rich repeat protein/YVTN family beta-propeller protein